MTIPPEPDPTRGDVLVTTVGQYSVLKSVPDTACARGKVARVYGRDLYLSDVSGDEVGTAFSGRRRRGSRHIKAPTFAPEYLEILYDCTEEYIMVKEDVLTYRRIQAILAVSIRMRNESSQKHIISRNKAMHYEKGWTSSQYDSIPDTKNPQESSLGFPRKAVWNIARAIGRARAVYGSCF